MTRNQTCAMRMIKLMSKQVSSINTHELKHTCSKFSPTQAGSPIFDFEYKSMKAVLHTAVRKAAIKC